jgi:hypothetical protein
VCPWHSTGVVVAASAMATVRAGTWRHSRASCSSAVAQHMAAMCVSNWSFIISQKRWSGYGLAKVGKSTKGSYKDHPKSAGWACARSGSAAKCSEKGMGCNTSDLSLESLLQTHSGRRSAGVRRSMCVV